MKAEATARLNATVARDLVAGFRAQGVRHAVVSPGSRNTPIVLALAEADVTIHVVLDERTAGFVALGLSRQTDGPVVLSCTSGSAGANYLPAVVEAYHARRPLVILTADRPEELQGRGAPQTMRQTNLYGQFVERSADIPAPESVEDCEPVSRLAQELARAAVESLAPVHLNVAFREPLWSPSVTLGHRERPPRLDTETQIDVPAEVAALMSTGRGLVICGPEAVSTPAERAVVLRFGERLGWPILAEASSGVRFGSTHPNLMTTYDAFMRTSASRSFVPECVVRFGKTNTSRAVNEWLAAVAGDRLIAVASSPFPHDPDQLAAAHLQMQAVDYCDAVSEVTPGGGVCIDWLSQWQSVEEALTALFDAEVCTEWWEGSIAQTVLAAAPEHAVVHLANSMPIRDVDSFCPPGGRVLEVYSNRGVNGIDGTLATAAGEALGRPDRPLIVLVGDLAFLHDASSLELLRARRATIVVIDNGGGGIFEFLPIAKHPDHFESLFITQQQTKPEAVAAAYGARAMRTHDLATFTRALGADIERDGLGVIVAEVPRKRNVVRHHELWAMAARLLEVTP